MPAEVKWELRDNDQSAEVTAKPWSKITDTDKKDHPERAMIAAIDQFLRDVVAVYEADPPLTRSTEKKALNDHIGAVKDRLTQFQNVPATNLANMLAVKSADDIADILAIFADRKVFDLKIITAGETHTYSAKSTFVYYPKEDDTFMLLAGQSTRVRELSVHSSPNSSRGRSKSRRSSSLGGSTRGVHDALAIALKSYVLSPIQRVLNKAAREHSNSDSSGGLTASTSAGGLVGSTSTSSHLSDPDERGDREAPPDYNEGVAQGLPDFMGANPPLDSKSKNNTSSTGRSFFCCFGADDKPETGPSEQEMAQMLQKGQLPPPAKKSKNR